MPELLMNWVLSAIGLFVVAKLVRGFEVDGCGSALLAAIVVGFVNGTLGALLKLVSLPLTILTLGLFIFVVNALMLKLAAALVPGFRIKGFVPAFWGAIVLSLVNLAIRYLFR
jgi:putative membrane protein